MPAEVRDMALGRLNNDAFVDVVVANRTSVFIFYGKGDGSLLSTPTVLSKAGMVDVRRVAVGDLDGDHRDDVAVTYTGASGNNPKVSAFYQEGGFATSLDISTYPEPYEVVIGRFDNTANNGLAVACKGKGLIHANITVVQYPFTELWNSINIPVPEFTNFQLLTAGHNNSDGRIDLVAGNTSGANVFVLTQPSSFSTNWDLRKIDIEGALTDIQMVNYSGNGIRDLVVVNAGYERVEIRVNDGAAVPGPSSRTIGQVSGASLLSIGAVTGSALPDLVTISNSNSDARLYPRQATGYDSSVYLRFPVNKGPINVQVLTQGALERGVYVLSAGMPGLSATLELFPYSSSKIGNADGSRYVGGGQPSEVCAGNISFEVVASIQTDLNSVFVTNLAGTASVTLPTQGAPSGLCIGDLDGDGVGDLAVINQGSGSVSIYKGGPGFMTKTSADAIVPLNLVQPQSIASGRIPGINHGVLVIGCRDGIEIVYDALSTYSLEEIGTGAGDRIEVAMGTFRPSGVGGDVASLNKGTGRVDIFYAKGAGMVGDCYNAAPDAWLNMVAYSPLSMAVGDFNGDGRSDVTASTSTNMAYLFLNENEGFITATTYTRLIPVSGAISQIRSADLNDDGLDDLLVSYSSIAKVSIYLSKGALGFVNPINMTSGGPANGSFAGDIDGDGRDDFLASSSAAPAMCYWLQNNLVPLASHWVSSDYITEGEAISFDALNSTDSFSDRSDLKYYWYFEPGGTSTQSSGQHLFAKSGTYDGYLRVTDRGGLTNTTHFRTVVTDIAPVASFTFSPDNGLENGTIWFNDTSTHYDAISWRWDFGDGNFSTLQNTTHKYLKNGTYHVWLNITDSDGKWDNATMDVHVADRSPVAGIWASATAIDENGTVTFRDSSLSNPDHIMSYLWDFGDGQHATGKELAHRFPVKGTYVASLTITDSDGSVASASVTITVNDTPPVASFTASKTNPREGELITLTDTSYSYDGITSWRWDLGDSRILPSRDSRNVTISYPVNGSYEVILTVTDLDGVSTSYIRSIVVQPTSPTIDSLSTGGRESFTMDEQINFVANAHQDLVPIVRYAWDFDYDATEGFVETPGITIGQATWSYRQAREYVVCVRVYDSNSYSEDFLTLSIQNMRPVASMTPRESQPGHYIFDASKCWDTNTDNASLQYRWNFGDAGGWTEWSSSKVAWSNYTDDGVYLVALEVRDQWDLVGTATFTALVDQDSPTIQLVNSSMPGQAYKGDEIRVEVNVTDVSQVTVVLVYEYGNHTYIVPMSRLSGTNTYVATIPSLNATGPLSFHIEAEDIWGHHSDSTPMSLSILDRPDDTWLYVLAAALATVVAILLLYLRALKMVVDEVFIIYEDGNLLAHQTRRLKPGMDDQILGSMLVAIQNFVRDSFKDEASTGLNRMDFGEKKVLVEKGDHIYLAVVLHGKREGKVPQRMRAAIELAESEFHDVLHDWDGDLEKVRGIKDRTETLLKGGVVDIMPSWGDGPETATPTVDTVECPVCGEQIGPDSLNCPHCGADVGTAGADELAAVAEEAKKEDK